MNCTFTNHFCYKLLSWSLLLFILLSCRPDEDLENPIIVSVYEENLRKDDLISMMPENFTQADSSMLADQIINQWVTEKAVLTLAQKNLSEGQKNFSAKLEDYRNSLITYAYERELVNQKLDTVVSDREIEKFFNENIENFKLKNFILKSWFIEVSADAPKRRKLTAWFQSDDPQDAEKLDDYCKKFAEFCFFDGEDWIYVDDLLKKVPLSVEDWGNFLKETSYYEFEKEGKLYLLRIFDYSIIGETAPLDLEREKVKNLIINKRKVDLVKKMRNDAVEEAYSDNEIKWIKNKE